jgi:hypothetical protein
MTAIYEHTQVGRAFICGLGAIILIIGGTAMISPDLRVLFVGAAGVAITLALMWKLTVRVDGETLRAAFGPGVIHKEVRLAEIESAEPIRTGWSAGVGIHYTRRGWLYNVAMGDAVAIRLRSGKQFCIGTDQAAELVAAIRRFASAR